MSTHFPVVPLEQARAKAGHDRSEPLRPIVLIVDDESLIAETLATILNGCGLAPITAADSKEALEIAGLIPPDLLLSDVMLPGMDGFRLAIEITRRAPDCEVILFSGQYSTCDLVAMHHRDGREFLTLIKPVHPVDMLSRVFERLSHHGWPVPAAFNPRPPSPYDVFSPGGRSMPNGGRHA